MELVHLFAPQAFIRKELTRDREAIYKRFSNDRTSYGMWVSGQVGKRYSVRNEHLEDRKVKALYYLHCEWSHESSGCELTQSELLRRQAIRPVVEPIIFLLGRAVVGLWTLIDHHCAKQVLVAFTLGHNIVPNCLAHLLEHPEAAPAAWRALKGMFSLHSFYHVMDKDDDKLWGVFLNRLEEPVESNMQREALDVIACAHMLDFYEFAFKRNNAEALDWDYTMVDALVSLLQRAPSNSEVKALCFRASANLLSWAWKNQHDDCKAETIARCSRLIDEIISALSSPQGLHSKLVNGHLSTLVEVLYTMCCLGDAFINGKVRGIEGFMDDLSHIVRDVDKNGTLQSTVVRAAGLCILLSPEEARNINVHSAASFRARGEAYSDLSMEKECEGNIQRAHELDPNYAADLYREWRRGGEQQVVVDAAKSRDGFGKGGMRRAQDMEESLDRADGERYPERAKELKVTEAREPPRKKYRGS